MGRVDIYTTERDAVAPVLQQNVFLLRRIIQSLPSTESWLRQKRQAMLAKSGSMACDRKTAWRNEELSRQSL
jgi:hypothetical protein